MKNINLSPQLFQELRQAVARQDPEAASDPGIVLQYLAAMTGYLLGSQNLPEEQSQGYLDELCGFARHVYQDSMQRERQRRQSMASQAFGYWEPPRRG